SPEYNPIERFWQWLKAKAYGATCRLTGKMPRLPDNLPRFFCCTARRSCHITCRDIRTGSVLMLPAPFCLLSARISDRNAILSGRERSSTPGAVSWRLHPQRRQNIRQESIVNAVKRTHILAADVLRPS